MRFKRGKKELKSHFDLTPLIDCVFILLIFFALSSTFILRPGIKVDLPRASIPGVQKRAEHIVTITRKGYIFLDGEPVDTDLLYAQLVSLVAKDQVPVLIIEADQMSYHGAVVKVMEVAKKAGVDRIAIATQPKEKKR